MSPSIPLGTCLQTTTTAALPPLFLSSSSSSITPSLFFPLTLLVSIQTSFFHPINHPTTSVCVTSSSPHSLDPNHTTMAAETENTLSKVDSLVEEPPKDAKPAKRRGSSLHADVFNMADLGELLLSLSTSPSLPARPSSNGAARGLDEGMRGLTTQPQQRRKARRYPLPPRPRS